MERVVAGLDDQNDQVALASVRCLHSMSRSVQQLRTTFKVRDGTLIIVNLEVLSKKKYYFARITLFGSLYSNFCSIRIGKCLI